MDRRTFMGILAAAGAAGPVRDQVASAQTTLKTKNVVFVHGLFADGSCWSKVIDRLQKKGVNCTSVQNPLTSLQEASDAARRAIAAQPALILSQLLSLFTTPIVYVYLDRLQGLLRPDPASPAALAEAAS